MRKFLLALLIRPLFVNNIRRYTIMQRQHVSFKLNDGNVEAESSPVPVPAPSTSPRPAPVSAETVDSDARLSTSPNPLARKRVSVALVIIGDEILKGHVSDVNSHFLCQRMTAVGADVRRISVVPDDKETIAQEIKQLQRKYRWIVAAGGVGPTHDDVTFQAIAEAFKVPLEKNEILVNLIRQHFSKTPDIDLTLAEEKLCNIPRGSTVIFGDIRNTDAPVPDSDSTYLKPGMYPVVRTENVIILPGIPILLQRAFNSVRHFFESEDGALAFRNVYVKLDELAFAETLSAIAEVHKPHVVIGSYPDLTNNYYRVKVVFESANTEALEAATKAFIEAMPGGSVFLDRDLPNDIIAEAEERIYNFSHPSEQLCAKVAHALHVTETIIKQYGQDRIAICFTGGKDCTAVLHILFAVLKHLQPQKPVHLLGLQLSTFEPFAEVERFIYDTKRRYGFQFESYIGPGMKESLNKFVEHHPEVLAVFMGTRRNDPSASKLTTIQKTDSGWPDLVRVSPILDWSYSEVWTFIRHLHLPYCSLYDRGYTSLGNPSTTHPNRNLLTRSLTTSLLRYRAAYELDDDLSERAGRDTPHLPAIIPQLKD